MPRSQNKRSDLHGTHILAMQRPLENRPQDGRLAFPEHWLDAWDRHQLQPALALIHGASAMNCPRSDIATGTHGPH